MKKTISIMLTIAMLVSLPIIFVSFADDTGKTLDFRSEKEVFEETELYANGITRGGLRNGSFDIAEEISFDTLTGIDFPEGGSSIDYETACLLYDAAVKTAENYSNVIFSEAWGFENVPISHVFDEELNARIENDIDSFTKEEITDLDRQIMVNRIAVAGIFWEFVTEYLPEGAADKLVTGVRRSSQKTIAVADIEKAGTSSIEEVYAKYHKGARDTYCFDNIVVFVDGTVIFYSADNDEELYIYDEEMFRIESILDNEYNKRLNERQIPIYNVNEDIELSSRQVVEVMKFIAGKKGVIDYNTADFNSDGKINSRDVIGMMKYIVNHH